MSAERFFKRGKRNSMQAETIIFNKAGLLRSGWRLAIFLFLFVFFGVLLQALAELLLIRLPGGYGSGSLLDLLVGSFVPLVIAIFAGWLCGRYLEGLPFRALGAWFTKYWLRDLLAGLILGAAAVSLAVFIAVVFGGLRFQLNVTAGQTAVLTTLGVSLAVFTVAAAMEEALFRGYMLQTFTRAGLAWLAITLTSVFFGLVHLGNPNVTWIAAVNTMIAGVWFSLAYLKTRTLWLAFGLHFMWNWMLGAFYGIEVSGLTDITTAPLFAEIDHGPVWLTGGNYGIEGSVSCTIALIGITLLIWFMPFLKPTEQMLELSGGEYRPKDIVFKSQTREELAEKSE